jgi:hypothetical protein
VGTVKKAEVCARIEEVGIIPAIRVSSADDARFAAIHRDWYYVFMTDDFTSIGS